MPGAQQLMAAYGTTTGAAYTGPGDVVSGATAWWGLRAYTAASIGANAVRLREDGGNTEQDFATIAGGGLDLASIATFKGANNLFVTKIYDQVGTNNYVQATTGSQLAFILGGFGSLPVIRGDGTKRMTSVSNVTQTQPFTVSSVYFRNSSASSYNSVFGATVSPVALGSDTTNSLFMYAGSLPSSPGADNTFHAVQGVFNGASSDLNINGSQNTVSAGSSGITAETVEFSGNGGGSNKINGDCFEVGMWASAFTPTAVTGDSPKMSANQRAYYVF